MTIGAYGQVATSTDEFEEDLFADELEFDHGADPSEQELEIIGSRDTRRRRRKSDMSKAPFRYICDLEYDFPDKGRWPWMTGFLVGPSTVMTAGHLVGSISGFDPKRMRVFPGRRGNHKPFGGTTATSIKMPANFESCAGSVSFNDYMLLFLKEPIGNKVGYWSFDYKKRSFDRKGTSTFKGGGLPRRAGVLKVNVCGYPDDKPGGKGCSTGGLRCNFTAAGDPGRSRLCGAYQYSAFDRTVGLIEGGKTLTYLNDICSGHSGSPVWVTRHSSKGGRVLIGIQVCQFADASANLVAFMHREMRDFLRAHAR